MITPAKTDEGARLEIDSLRAALAQTQFPPTHFLINSAH